MAALKPGCWDLPVASERRCSPRRASRGRIEAQQRLDYLYLPLDVLHGERAVAALKQKLLLSCQSAVEIGSPRPEQAVAALKLHANRGANRPSRFTFSTASEPWPH